MSTHKTLIVLGAAESGIGAALLGKQQRWEVERNRNKMSHVTRVNRGRYEKCKQTVIIITIVRRKE